MIIAAGALTASGLFYFNNVNFEKGKAKNDHGSIIEEKEPGTTTMTNSEDSTVIREKPVSSLASDKNSIPTGIPQIKHPGIVLPSASIYSSDNFTLYTGANKKKAEEYLIFFEAFKRYFSLNYYDLSGLGKIQVYIFLDPADYDKYKTNDSAYGYYLYDEHLFVSHDQAGFGTYAHELVHAFTNDMLLKQPDWFIEGFPTFFEKLYGYYNENGELKLVLGAQNPWRVQELVQAIDSGKEVKPTLLAVARHESAKGNERLLSLYLYKNGWLSPYVNKVKSAALIDNNAQFILDVSGKSLSDLEKDWSIWLDEVIADAKSSRSSLNNIPTSFVLNNKKEWDAWLVTHNIPLP